MKVYICDRCGMKIDKHKQITLTPISENYIEDKTKKDLCGICYAKYLGWLNEGVKA